MMINGKREAISVKTLIDNIIKGCAIEVRIFVSLVVKITTNCIILKLMLIVT